MKKLLPAILFILGFVCCKLPAYTYKYKTVPPEIEILDTSKGILLVNGELLPESYTAMNQTSPDPKLFKESNGIIQPSSSLINLAKTDYLDNLSDELQKDLRLNVSISRDLNRDEMQLLLAKNPGIADKLMAKYNAGIIIILKSEEGGFKLKKVEKIKYTNNTHMPSKTALYDIFYNTKVVILQDNIYLDRDIFVSKYHSERSIVRDFPVSPPKEKTNKEDIAAIAKENSIKLAQLFMERKVIETFINNKHYYTEIQE